MLIFIDFFQLYESYYVTKVCCGFVIISRSGHHFFVGDRVWCSKGFIHRNVYILNRYHPKDENATLSLFDVQTVKKK